jgi:hypothetical protein
VSATAYRLPLLGAAIVALYGTSLFLIGLDARPPSAAVLLEPFWISAASRLSVRLAAGRIPDASAALIRPQGADWWVST